jgi:hypothetical protein
MGVGVRLAGADYSVRGGGDVVAVHVRMSNAPLNSTATRDRLGSRRHHHHRLEICARQIVAQCEG